MVQDAPRKVRILVVEDEQDQREILLKWLKESGYLTMGARDGLEAVDLFQQQTFDVIVMDLKLPGLNGLQLLGLIKELQPRAIVIFLSGGGTMDDAISALRQWRAYDFIRKPLRELRQLNLVIEKAMLNRQVGFRGAGPGEAAGEAQLTESLTARELELARLLVQGHKSRAIAEHLSLSEKTVRNKLTLLYEKLGVGNRVQAVLYCLRHQVF
jgi:Response regulator containing a CheY-like receiver domain and an HTH DNA-binding domain